MKIFKRVLLWILIVIIALAVISFLLPKMVTVQRSVRIGAAPSTVYALLADLKTYDKWMTWNQIDPAMKKQYGDTTQGAGAWYAWKSSNPNVGNGKLTITDARPSQQVLTRLEFEGSDAATGGWFLTPERDSTLIKWEMVADMGNNPVARWMGVFVVDKMIGEEFEKGLGNLKKLAEENKEQAK